MSRGRQRPVAGRDQILGSARAIGVREGWRAVTIRSVANALGYSSPVLYEHFRDKEDLLTQLAVEAVALLEANLTQELPKDSRTAALAMVERYWSFMLENTQLYRLMNGMDGVPIDNEVVGRSAQSLCTAIGVAIRPLAGKNTTEAEAQMVAEELWALLHGMAMLYLDRSAPFDLHRATNAALRLIAGARVPQVVRPSSNRPKSKR
jgi:AcrR family transcriptional regulator